MRRINRFIMAGLLALASLGLVAVSGQAASASVPRHYVANVAGAYATAAGLGYNLEDVSSKAVMDALPAGAQGLYWIGNYNNTNCGWSLSDAQVTTIVNANKGDAKFSGIYYTADEPHRTNCPNAVSDVTARTALVHSLDSSAKTMVTVLDGFNFPGEYQAFANSGDYIAVDPYPCRVDNSGTGCDLTAMTARIDTALQYIPASRIVPVFQLFGQTNVPANFYRLPTLSELQSMLAIWDQKVPTTVRPFDYSYSWNHQSVANPTLVDANGTNGYPDLQTAIANYFTGMVPVTITLPAAADTYVASETPTDNFGAQTTMCASSDSGGVSRTLLKFNVSGVNGRIVTSAQLTLGVYNGSTDTLDVRRVADQSWTESGVNWNNQPPADSTVLTTIPQPATGGTATVNLLGLITGDGTYTAEVLGHTSDSACFQTKESTGPAPQLVITAQH